MSEVSLKFVGLFLLDRNLEKCVALETITSSALMSLSLRVCEVPRSRLVPDSGHLV